MIAERACYKKQSGRVYCKAFGEYFGGVGVVLHAAEDRVVYENIDVTELLDHTRKERADRLFVLLIVFVGVYGVARFTQRGCIFFVCVNVARCRNDCCAGFGEG